MDCHCCVLSGDTFIVSDIMSHDRRIPIPAFSEYAKGNFSALSTPNLVTVRGSDQHATIIHCSVM